MTDIQAECIRRIAETKGIDPSAIERDTSLESLAVDSLDRVSLAFDLEELYGVEMPEAELHTLRTVGDVADAVQRLVADKQADVAGRSGTSL